MKRTWKLGLILAAGLLIGACGDSEQTVVDKPKSERSTTTAEDTTTTTEKVARVGDTLTLGWPTDRRPT